MPPYTIGIEVVGSQARGVLMDTTYDPLTFTPHTEDEAFSLVVGLNWPEGRTGIGALRVPDIKNMVKDVTQLVLAKKHITMKEIQGVGVALVTAVDFTTSRMIPPDEMVKHAHPVEIVQSLRRELRAENEDLNVEVLNRSHLGAWTELYYGRGKPDVISNLVYLTYSYYIDLGIVTNRKLYRGSRGLSGQISHTIVDPGASEPCELCGAHGCLWKTASGRSLMKGLKAQIEQGAATSIDSMMLRYSEEELLKLDRGGVIGIQSQLVPYTEIFVRAVVDAAQEANDTLAQAALNRAGMMTGRAIAQVVNVLNPDLIIIGGVAAYSGIFIEAVRNAVHELTLSPARENLIIGESSFGDMAALFGAAIAVRKNQTLFF